MTGLWRSTRLAAPLLAATLALPYVLAPSPTPPPAWEDIDLGGLPEIRSVHGVLRTVLVATPKTVRIGDASFAGAVYNDSYPGPVLRVRPGDMVFIRLVNHTAFATNLHFHGLRVTPQGSGDNIHIVVPPGSIYDYAFQIPFAQPPGLFWYHDHLHGQTEAHVAAGLSGAILIDGFPKGFGGLANISEKMFVIKDISLEKCQGPILKARLHCRIISINGKAAPHFAMRPGETQLWRICNQGANLWAHLSIPGVKLAIVGRDGTPSESETPVKALDVMPAARLDVLVTANATGHIPLLALQTLTGAGKALQLDRDIGAIDVAGERIASASLISFPHQEDLRYSAVTARRVISFTENADADKYFIDGKLYDHDRLDLRVPLGSLEEWVVRNRTQDFHEFHIHQIGFQVTEINGVNQPFDGYVDDVQVPEMGEVKLLLPFTDPVILGEFVYHCHVLKHEDRGMMANIEIYRNDAEANPHICRFAELPGRELKPAAVDTSAQRQ